jgi:hypothetical protein
MHSNEKERMKAFRFLAINSCFSNEMATLFDLKTMFR